MKKTKIWTFVGFISAGFIHIVLANSIKAYEPYQQTGLAIISFAFAAVFFYFGLCHSKGWHGAEIRKVYNEWYAAALFVLICALVMVFDFGVLEFIKEKFFTFSCIVIGIEGYRKTKEKVYLLYISISLVLLLWDYWPQIIHKF